MSAVTSIHQSDFVFWNINILCNIVVKRLNTLYNATFVLLRVNTGHSFCYILQHRDCISACPCVATAVTDEQNNFW